MYKISQSVDIDTPVEVCYKHWTQFERFPEIMPAVVKKVEKGKEAGVWHWEIKGPLGKILKWDAMIDMTYPNKWLSWHTEPGSEVDTSGSVNFHAYTGNEKSRLDVDMSYVPPAGPLGEVVAFVIKNPDMMVAKCLQAFKHFVESQKLLIPK